MLNGFNELKNAKFYLFIRMRAFSKIETISVEFSKLSIAPAIDSSSRFKTELMLGEISNQVLDTF